MKEEEEEEALWCGGEISLGLRTDTSGCFLHSGSQSCEKRFSGSQAQSRRDRGLHIIGPKHSEYQTLFANSCARWCSCDYRWQLRVCARVSGCYFANRGRGFKKEIGWTTFVLKLSGFQILNIFWGKKALNIRLTTNYPILNDKTYFCLWILNFCLLWHVFALLLKWYNPADDSNSCWVTHGGMTLFSLYQLTTSCTWQWKTPAPVSFTVTLHFPLAYVFVSLRRLQRTMAFAGMLSDEDIRAAVQACQSESDNTHTHTLTHWWDAAKFTPALCFNIIFRYPELYVSNSIFCNFLLRLHLTNKKLPPAWIYFRSWATWEI